MSSNFFIKSFYFFLLIVAFTIQGAFSQNFFFCDTSGILLRNDSVVIFRCNYFFNFNKNTKDSVVLSTRKKEKERITIEASIRNNKLNGPVRYFLFDTLVFMKGFMKNNLPDSIFISYHLSSTSVRKEASRSFFTNGVKEGTEVEHNDKGIVIFIRNFKDGVLNGEFKHYDDYGNIISNGVYKKGKKIETWLEAYPEDKIAIYQKYKNDELVSYIFTSFYTTGELFTEGTYDKNGLKQGAFVVYDLNGMLKRAENYKDGKLDGYFTEYFDGKPIRKMKYHNDKVVKDFL